jgi:hypothetical protein
MGKVLAGAIFTQENAVRNGGDAVDVAMVIVHVGSRVSSGNQHKGAQASKRLHRNMLAIALANKLARIAWAVLARGREY